MDNDNKSLGQIGYIAYGESVGWKNYQGLPMPTWEALTEAIRAAWQAAANAIQDAVIRDLEA